MYPQGRKNLPFGTKSGGGGNVGADGANTSSAHVFGTGGGGDFGLLLYKLCYRGRQMGGRKSKN